MKLRALAWLLRALAAFFGRLSWPASQRIGRGIGSLGWQLSRRDRRRTLDHLAIAFPALSLEERRRLGRASFRHLGENLAECLHALSRSGDQLLSHLKVEGWEGIEAARAAGKPLVLITGHCGNWEFLAATVSLQGLPLTVVARALDHPALDGLLSGLRRHFGTETIGRGSEGAARQLLASLRQGRALGMLIDQDTKVDGVWVPFFGRPAFTPVAAARIALKQKAVVIPCFTERLPDGSHRVVLHPPLELPVDPVEATALLTRFIEEQIRRVPEQWVWMHRRWRRQPV